MQELDTRFDHKSVEEKIYKLWEKSGYFRPENLPIGKEKAAKTKSQKINKRTSALRRSAFTIIMPPPNANGSLHIGHAVFVTLQDILIRFWRMRGKKTLWLPGADHAGFETQVVFDKKLEKEGRDRFSMAREELWQEILEFTQKNKAVMENQLRKLGASCDWSREKFTLDPDIIEGVNKTFQKLYEDGLVYRDIKVINWCPKHRTALSDLEVKYIERTDPLYYIKYGPLTVATVRPETKFGDTALAVNSKDKRYKKYVGKEIKAEGILGPLKFKVIADEAVDPKFGTGVVKVTPAHDPADFEIWKRHKNEIPGPKVVIDETGRLNEKTGPFAGLKVSEAREKVAEKMKEIGILEKIESDYVHQVATCYKCGNTLEPLPKPQWFISMTKKPRGQETKNNKEKKKALRDLGIDAVKSGKIKFYPGRIKKVYFHWLNNIRDWNISRQIVWGIRIPAWFCLRCKEVKINPEIKSRWFLVRHGQSISNKRGEEEGAEHIKDDHNHLTENGIAQAKNAAQILKAHKIDLIISSDLTRTKETAKIIQEATRAEIILDKELRERHYGSEEGIFGKERNEKWKEALSSYEGKIPGGESFKELEERVHRAFEKHKSKHHHKNIVIVTHHGVIQTLFKRLKNWTHEEMISQKVQNAQVFEIDILKDPCKKCGGDLFEQDTDVFDTWFSSGQWPFLTLGFDKNSSLPKSKIKNQKSKTRSDFENFYPTDVMETGYDILFFWVARMIMLGIYRTGKIPFKNVYLHGLVRDKDRQKMSKSKGNVIDPLEVAEIYGADALRMALVAGNTAGNDIVISEEKIRGYRNFATKIWNVSRFVLIHKEKIAESGLQKNKIAKLTQKDKKDIKETEKLKKAVTKHLERFEFHLAAEKIYHYFWHTFADKVIEAAKPRLNGENSEDKIAAYQTLETILLECLKMLHPFIPFVTEEIYRKFKPEKMLMIERWE